MGKDLEAAEVGVFKKQKGVQYGWTADLRVYGWTKAMPGGLGEGV